MSCCDGNQSDIKTEMIVEKPRKVETLTQPSSLNTTRPTECSVEMETNAP